MLEPCSNACGETRELPILPSTSTRKSQNVFLFSNPFLILSFSLYRCWCYSPVFGSCLVYILWHNPQSGSLLSRSLQCSIYYEWLRGDRGIDMEGILPAEEQHGIFTAWVKERGVKVNAVGPARINGRGLGIVATRKITVPIYSRLKPYALQD